MSVITNQIELLLAEIMRLSYRVTKDTDMVVTADYLGSIDSFDIFIYRKGEDLSQSIYKNHVYFSMEWDLYLEKLGEMREVLVKVLAGEELGS